MTHGCLRHLVSPHQQPTDAVDEEACRAATRHALVVELFDLFVVELFDLVAVGLGTLVNEL